RCWRTCAASPPRDRWGPTRLPGCSSGSSTKRDGSSVASFTAKTKPYKSKVESRKSESQRGLMVVVMEERATEAQIEQVVKRLVEMGMDVHRSTGVTRTVLGAVGRGTPDKALLELLDGVHEVLRITEPYKLASRTFKGEPTVINVGDVRIGGDEVIVMAGPCSAETEPQVRSAAAAVRRAGAFKPRSSPYSFQGLGEEGLRLLRNAADAENLKLVTEVMDLSQIEMI